jgi:hypothetical protein
LKICSAGEPDVFEVFAAEGHLRMSSFVMLVKATCA